MWPALLVALAAAGILGTGGDLLKSFVIEPRTMKLQEKMSKAEFRRQMAAMSGLSARQTARENELLERYRKMDEEDRTFRRETQQADIAGALQQQRLGVAGGLMQQGMAGLSAAASADVPMPGNAMGLVELLRMG